MVREYTTKLLDGIEEGYYDKDTVIDAFCAYMSEDDVKEMMESNDMLDDEEVQND